MSVIAITDKHSCTSVVCPFKSPFFDHYRIMSARRRRNLRNPPGPENDAQQDQADIDQIRLASTRTRPYVVWDQDNPLNWTITELKDRLWRDLGIRAPVRNVTKAFLWQLYLENKRTTLSSRLGDSAQTSVEIPSANEAEIPDTEPRSESARTSLGNPSANEAEIPEHEPRFRNDNNNNNNNMADVLSTL